MCALALAALDGVGSLQLYLGSNAEHALKLRGEFLLKGIDSSGRVEDAGEVLLTDFHLYLQGVEVVDTVDNEHVAWCELRHAENHTLHL